MSLRPSAPTVIRSRSDVDAVGSTTKSISRRVNPLRYKEAAGRLLKGCAVVAVFTTLDYLAIVTVIEPGTTEVERPFEYFWLPNTPPQPSLIRFRQKSIEQGELRREGDSIECVALGAVQAKTCLSWIVEGDSRAAAMFRKGRWVEKLVPTSDPIPRRITPSTPDSDVWDARASLGELIRPVLLPTPSRMELFDYQQKGVEWLLEAPGRILADDMGLGKTVQAIQAFRELVHGGLVRQALVVGPRTLIENWIAELDRWAPELVTASLAPTLKTRVSAWRALIGGSHALITSYEQIRAIPEGVLEREFDLLLFDEAHRIRKSDSAVSQAVRRLRHQRVWILTGTPVERDAEDMATLLGLIDADRFGPRDARLGVSALRSAARPFVLRRKKSDLLEELPPVVEVKEMLSLSGDQRESYIEALSVGRTDRNYFALLSELRSICEIHPETGSSTKVDRALELIAEIGAQEEKTVVFSFLLEPLRALSLKLDDAGLGHQLLTGDMSLADRGSALDQFKSQKESVALLASSRIGGEGLTLTEANHVIFLNEWWNPSSNQQAQDRVVRIGQERTVNVYRFRIAHTVDALLDAALERKSKLYESLIESLAGDRPSDGASEAARDAVHEAERELSLLLSVEES